MQEFCRWRAEKTVGTSLFGVDASPLLPLDNPQTPLPRLRSTSLESRFILPFMEREIIHCDVLVPGLSILGLIPHSNTQSGMDFVISQHVKQAILPEE